MIAPRRTPGAERSEPATVSPAPVAFLAVSLGALALFFLLRPFLGGQDAYRPRPPGTTYDYWFVVLAAFPAYAFALARFRHGGPPVRTLLRWTAILYAVLIPAAAVQSQDVYQYLVYGKMASGGVNPYVVDPATTGDAWLRFTLWDDARTVYGPLWTAVSAAVVRGADGSLQAAFIGMKAVTAGLAVTSAWLLAAATRGPGRDGGTAVLAFALNPLVVVSVGVGAHADIAVAAAFAGAALALRRERPIGVTLLLVVAMLVKAYAGLALLAWLIALVRRRGWGSALTHTGVAGVTIASAYSPFWEGPARTFTGLGQIARLSSASLTGSIERLLSGSPSEAATAVPAVRIAALVLLVVAIAWVARSRDDDPWAAGSALLGVYVLLSPWYLPWHLLGPLALAALLHPDSWVARSIQTFSATSLVVAGGTSAFGGRLAEAGLVLQSLLRYVPPLWVARLSSRPGTPRSTPASRERSGAGRRSPADDTS
ncbi:MAG: glycosyltransferase 87 family protein [Actinomycetota bacterium]|nr:glycosyltransferase 87 family protein [Actinomycetota bacterium]